MAETQPGIACREMVTDWPFGSSGPIGANPRFDVGPDGRAYLLFGRLAYDNPLTSTGYVDWLVGDVDGPLAFAMRRPASKPFTCAAPIQGLRGGRFVLNLIGDGQSDAIDSTVDGALVGEIGNLVPSMRRRDESSAQSSWSIGAGWVERTTLPGGMFLHSPDFTEELLLYNPATDPDGLPGNATYPSVIGKNVIFEVGNLGMSGIMAYDEATGTHPLVRWYGDTSQGAANVGTDGVDIVWTYGEGKGPGEFVYPKLSIMTAPFTTDASKLQAKRLRSDPYPSVGTYISAFSVGCGYAGHISLPGYSVIIVRLTDGQSWQLDPTTTFGYKSLLGFTCEEAFLLAVHDGLTTIARVRLDSLGPGLAPD